MATLELRSEPLPLRVDADGAVRVGRTRVTLDSILVAFNEGATAEEIAAQYPSVNLPDVYGVISYYLRHRDAVDAYLGHWRDEGAELRLEIERRFDPHGVRDRLLARRATRS